MKNRTPATLGAACVFALGLAAPVHAEGWPSRLAPVIQFPPGTPPAAVSKQSGPTVIKPQNPAYIVAANPQPRSTAEVLPQAALAAPQQPAAAPPAPVQVAAAEAPPAPATAAEGAPAASEAPAAAAEAPAPVQAAEPVAATAPAAVAAPPPVMRRAPAPAVIAVPARTDGRDLPKTREGGPVIAVPQQVGQSNGPGN